MHAYKINDQHRILTDYDEIRSLAIWDEVKQPREPETYKQENKLIAFGFYSSRDHSYHELSLEKTEQLCVLEKNQDMTYFFEGSAFLLHIEDIIILDTYSHYNNLNSIVTCLISTPLCFHEQLNQSRYGITAMHYDKEACNSLDYLTKRTGCFNFHGIVSNRKKSIYTQENWTNYILPDKIYRKLLR